MNILCINTFGTIYLYELKELVELSTKFSEELVEFTNSMNYLFVDNICICRNFKIDFE